MQSQAKQLLILGFICQNYRESFLLRSSMQPCNPAVGGPAKSQLVHEVDALGGEIGKVSDR